MKIAVPARDGLVDAHFGHCDHFLVFTVDELKAITAEERVDSPPSCGCKSGIAGVLSGKGVTHMVAGDMGDGAVKVLTAHGIEVVRGAHGNARKAAELFARGELSDTGVACRVHGNGHHHGREDN